MHNMSRDEWHEFVTAGTRTGKLAIVRADGSPHVVPIWFVLDTVDDQDYVIFNTGENTVKGKALRRDPRFSVCVDDQEPPFSFVTISGVAEISDDLDEMLPWSTELGARYMGADAAEQFGKRNAVKGELLVRGRITRVVAQAEISA
ncbi:MAG TPA: PPOX class F420-dependent oxidoreductase [Pseudonocardiaceae bacterium]|nr:PPOX class F420-dependent oxidoreductase [Pseudonocardiaceae bacterium]